MSKIQEIIKKYQKREKLGYEYTPIGEVIGDLQYLRPKFKKPKKEEERKDEKV